MSAKRGSALVENGGDAEQVRAAERTIEQREEQLRRAAAQLLRTPEGVVFAAEVLRACGYDASLYPAVGGHPELSWNAGQQEVGKHIAKLLRRASPQGFAQVLAALDEVTNG